MDSSTTKGTLSTIPHGGKSGLNKPGAGVVLRASHEDGKDRGEQGATASSGLVQGVTEEKRQQILKGSEDHWKLTEA